MELQQHATEVLTDNEARLVQIQAEVEHHHSLCLDNYRTALTHALAAGALLTEAKKLCGHGNFTKWLEHSCSVSDRTARAYMQLYKKLPVHQDIPADLTIERALKLIAAPKQNQPVLPGDYQVIDQASFDSLGGESPAGHRDEARNDDEDESDEDEEVNDQEVRQALHRASSVKPQHALEVFDAISTLVRQLEHYGASQVADYLLTSSYMNENRRKILRESLPDIIKYLTAVNKSLKKQTGPAE